MSWALRDVSARVSTRRHEFVSPASALLVCAIVRRTSNCSPYKNTRPCALKWRSFGRSVDAPASVASADLVRAPLQFADHGAVAEGYVLHPRWGTSVRPLVLA
jgi:hypothetical protein